MVFKIDKRMLELILIAIATGIVSRLAKNKGRNPVLLGMVTVVVTLVCAFIGAYFLGLAGDFLGVFVGGVIVEEVVRNMPAKPSAKKQVFCPQCGLKQAWEEHKLCEQCESPLRQ